MEQGNIKELTGREEACKKVKQIAEVIKKLKINNYLKIGGLSEEDQNAIQLLEKNMDTIAEENGLQKLAQELKKVLSARYDINNNYSKNFGDLYKLDSYLGAIDAETQALRTGKITKARRCQEMANKILDNLDEICTKRAIEYKRALFGELSNSLENSKVQVEQWMNIYKNCLKPNEFLDRKKILNSIVQKMKGCEIGNGNRDSTSIDRSI